MNPKLQKKISTLDNTERFPADQLMEFLPVNKNDKVLDLGAGTGYISLSIAERVQTVYALDCDKDVLDYMETLAKNRGIANIKSVVGNFKDIPLDNQFIDTAIASIALHEVQPLSIALKEINRILKDKGLFLCIELEKTEASKGPRVSSKDMEVEIMDAGFTIVNKLYPSIKIANQSIYIILAQK
ncbi:class I SAM-dependent methyltransferase [Paenibacillus pabuli]|uniref:class I SAM-dependent methyltransferase n=1 Tax=Paenibacillus pabuli TaxID=1472 RepID=UPI0007834DD3|nr:methyltransferase domain-containing protein [Paenibacillus pabuli]MEC0127863.1 methyltransferase domain-containing protein [Paenibacillus pabuli]